MPDLHDLIDLDDELTSPELVLGSQCASAEPDPGDRFAGVEVFR